jgi:serine/threonine-protein kinase
MAGNGDAGQVLGGYVLGKRLGVGATSVVYEARHHRLGRRAAVKVLAAPDAVYRERFLRESQMAAAIDHPNVIPVYDAGEADGELFLAMRCVEGQDLRALLVEEGRLTFARTVRLVRQVAAALDAAHARGLVHRDVKPANILIDESDHVYLSDFGVAKDAAVLGLTHTGGFLGTVEYAAPEQIAGADVDGRADLYALACVAYECLAGAAPFHRSSEVAVLHAHLHDPVPDIRNERPELPAAVNSVFRRGLAKAPEDRYDAGAAFARALEAASHRRSSHVPRRRLVFIAAVALIAAAAAAAIAWSLSSSSTHRSQPPPRTSTATPTVSVADAHALTDAASAEIRVRQFVRALHNASKAVAALRGRGPADPYEGYANYDLGYSLLELGRCPQALVALRRANALEHARAVRSALARAEHC